MNKIDRHKIDPDLTYNHQIRWERICLSSDADPLGAVHISKVWKSH